MYIVYDKATHEILRTTDEPPTLAVGEAMQKTTVEAHRVDMMRIMQGIRAGSLATAANADAARQASITFFNEYRPGHTYKKEEMLPTPCSPTGQNPPTHWFCWWRAEGGAAEVDAARQYIVDHNVPEIVEHAESRDEFLAKFNLKEIR